MIESFKEFKQGSAGLRDSINQKNPFTRTLCSKDNTINLTVTVFDSSCERGDSIYLPI